MSSIVNMESFVQDNATNDPVDNFEGELVLEEEVDMKSLRIIRDNFGEVYKRMGEECWVLNSNTNEYEKTDEKTALTIINELYNSKMKSNNVEYHYASRLKSGRRFAKNSLQGLSRKLRHTIAKSLYYDIDIVNAHPTFLLNLCKKLEFEHPILEEYVNNRDDLLKLWIGTDAGFIKEKNKFVKYILRGCDDTKQYFLKIINGGGNNSTSNVMLNNFYNKQQMLLDIFYKKPEFKRFRDRAYKKVKKEANNDTQIYDNKRGSALNHYLCEIENIVLTHIEKFLKDHEVKYGTLCFDGIMVYKRDVSNINKLLKDLEVYLHDAMGYTIKLKCKEMNEDINISDLYPKEDIKTSDEDYALLLLDKIKDDIMYDKKQGELWYYDEETALWSLQKMKYIHTQITKHLIPYIQTSPDPKIITEEIENIKSNCKQTAIIRMCEPYIEKRSDEKFIAENFDNLRGVFPIANRQVIDLRTGEIRPRRKTDYFTKTTNRSIVEVSEEKRKEILNYYASMLKTESIEYRDNLITVFAYILTGENNQKAIPNLIGNRDGGKSTFLNHHHSIFEDFACYANTRVFIEQKNNSNHDSELFNLRARRMACLSETSKKQRYNVTLMKEISGGDKINIRGAGDKKTIDEKFNCVMVLVTNEMAEFEYNPEEDSFPSRLWCFDFCNKFERNSAVVDKLREDIDAYFTILCEYAKKHYYDCGKKLVKCPQVEKFTKKQCENQDSVKWWCDKNQFERGEYDDFVEKTQLFEQYKDDCHEDKVKNIVGKTDFYKRFEKYYELRDSVQIKYKNEFNTYTNIRGYRYLKKVVD
jgi:phage/plasmid-associated DNA primase